MTIALVYRVVKIRSVLARRPFGIILKAANKSSITAGYQKSFLHFFRHWLFFNLFSTSTFSRLWRFFLRSSSLGTLYFGFVAHRESLCEYYGNFPTEGLERLFLPTLLPSFLFPTPPHSSTMLPFINVMEYSIIVLFSVSIRLCDVKHLIGADKLARKIKLSIGVDD